MPGDTSRRGTAPQLAERGGGVPHPRVSLSRLACIGCFERGMAGERVEIALGTALCPGVPAPAFLGAQCRTGVQTACAGSLERGDAAMWSGLNCGEAENKN